jgi:hypothetical protein
MAVRETDEAILLFVNDLHTPAVKIQAIFNYASYNSFKLLELYIRFSYIERNSCRWIKWDKYT